MRAPAHNSRSAPRALSQAARAVRWQNPIPGPSELTAAGRLSQLSERKAKCLPALSLSSFQEETTAVISKDSSGLFRRSWSTREKKAGPADGPLQAPQLRAAPCCQPWFAECTSPWVPVLTSQPGAGDGTLEGLEPPAAAAPLKFSVMAWSLSIKISLKFPLFLACALTELIRRRSAPCPGAIILDSRRAPEGKEPAL